MSVGMHRSRLGARPPRARPGVPGTARAARQSPAPRPPPPPPPRSVSVNLNGRPSPRAGAGDTALRVRAQLLMLSRNQLVHSSRPFAACLCFAAAGASRPRVLIHQLGSTNNDKGDIDENQDYERLREMLMRRSNAKAQMIKPTPMDVGTVKVQEGAESAGAGCRH